MTYLPVEWLHPGSYYYYPHTDTIYKAEIDPMVYDSIYLTPFAGNGEGFSTDQHIYSKNLIYQIPRFDIEQHFQEQVELFI